MKRFALLALLGLAGCLNTSSDDGSDCFGLRRTEQTCVFKVAPAPGYECTKMRWIEFDFERLPPNDVSIQCGATADESVIIILNPSTGCEDHAVTGCVK